MDGSSFDIILPTKNLFEVIKRALKHKIYNFRECLRFPANYFELFVCVYAHHFE